MSMVFQSYAIWPHMTVFDNVAYGLRVRKDGGAALKEKVHHALDLVKMGAYADRNASQLSGGQQQRVALARACRVLADRCCCSTSRCRTSTPSCGRRCASSCASCSAGCR